jgi:hypothetical protein
MTYTARGIDHSHAKGGITVFLTFAIQSINILDNEVIGKPSVVVE